MACPACGEQSFPKTPEIFTPGSHIPIAEWLQQIEEAMRAGWPQNVPRYSKAAVLMLSWEDGDIKNTSDEFIRLKNVFKDEYHYEVDDWQIPTRMAKPSLGNKANTFLMANYGRENLLIVYYAGHARRGEPPGSPPIWRSKSGLDEGAEVDTSVIQAAFTGTDPDSPDTLFLYDCCFPICTQYSGSKPVRTVVECLCAGGFESKVPMPGPNSFTDTLVHELSLNASSKLPLSVPELHNKLLSRLAPFRSNAVFDRENSHRRTVEGNRQFTRDNKKTPVYLLLSVNRPTRTIFLTPKPTTSLTAVGFSKQQNTDKNGIKGVLVAVRVPEEEKAVREEVERWLAKKPDSVAVFTAFHAGCSTLLLVKVPVVIWNLLPPSAAVSFVGFLTEPLDISPQSTKPWGPSNLLSQSGVSGGPDERITSTLQNMRLPVHQRPQTPAGGEQLAAQTTKSRPLIPQSAETGNLVFLLDYIDEVLPYKFASLNYADTRAGESVVAQLLNDISKIISSDRKTHGKVASELISAHEELLRQYINARLLLENKDPFLDIRRRLKAASMWQYHDDDVPNTGPDEDFASLSGTAETSLSSTSDDLSDRDLNKPHRRFR